MKQIYGTELEGMIEFWNEVEPSLKHPYVINDNKYVCNTDGRTVGCLVEFKLDALDEAKNLDQMKRYIKAYNTRAIYIPKYGLLVSINMREYKYFDMETGSKIKEGSWKDSSDLANLIDIDNTQNGWIDSESLISYSDYYYGCNTTKKSKDNFIAELANPSFLKIKPYIWNETGDMEKSLLDQIGPNALKKRLGAFFTPDYAVKKSTEYLREVIKSQPDDNYVIVDRCCGTGNLEKLLTDNELSHCILNTLVFAEWNTLNGLYGGRCIILPKDASSLQADGTLEDGDALSEKFCNDLKSAIGGRRTIFMENPPYAEPQAEATRSGNTSKGTMKNFITERMKKDSNVKGKASTDLANKFIWSVFNYFNCNNYIVYSPIKYWKSQHLIDKKLLNGVIVNREDFHATEAGISLISWKNENTVNNELNLENCIVKKVNKESGKLLPASKDIKIDFLCTSYSGTPDFKHGFLASNKKSAGNAGGVSYCEANDKNIKERLPLFVANCYSPKGFLEKEIIMKSGDGGLNYLTDNDFVNDCIIYAGLTDKNKCIADATKNNEMCFDGSAKLNAFYVPSTRSNTIMACWNDVIVEAKKCSEYNPVFNYGLYQIEEELNLSIDLTVNGITLTDKTGKVKKTKKYPKLDSNIKILKTKLKNFYDDNISQKLFDYELLK